jgi:hypothetical protein
MIQLSDYLNSSALTDRSNLVSLKKHGLLSARELRRRGIAARFGGNQWSIDRDLATGMDAYVHLCFKTGHPMEKAAVDGGAIEHLVHLKINPEIIKLPGLLVTDDVSNKVGVTSGPAADMLDKIDLEVLYTRMKWQGEILERLKRAEKCEVLVPTEVLSKYVLEWPNG